MGCSYPLQEPVTLPCGNSICRKCIPELHLRQNISYPATPNRLQGFTCPFPICGVDHAAGDYSVDVVLNKVMYMVRKEIEAYANSVEASEIVYQLQERDRWSIAGVTSLRDEEVRSRVFAGASEGIYEGGTGLPSLLWLIPGTNHNHLWPYILPVMSTPSTGPFEFMSYLSTKASYHSRNSGQGAYQYHHLQASHRAVPRSPCCSS